MKKLTIQQVYQHLFKTYGQQNWWPGDSFVEVMIGAVLTQNTAWRNVEKAIYNLKQAQCLDAKKILKTSDDKLAAMLKPSGYFNVKVIRLKNFCCWYVENGEYQQLKHWHTEKLRDALLSINGIGEETADDILLYAFNRPIFVIDAYTKRLFSRLGLVDGSIKYASLQAYFHQRLIGKYESDGKTNSASIVALFNEYHALIVLHSKDVCKTRPQCVICCLNQFCAFYRDV